MSGVNRNILADVEARLNRGESVSYAEYKAAFSPENIRNEKGTADEDKSEAK